MSSTYESFCPAYGTGVVVSPGVASASSTLTTADEGVVITNLSTTVLTYVRVGEGSQTATTADFPLPPSAQVSLSKGKTERTVAYIAPAGGGSIHIISGRGLR
jgi:hypothetical protein